MNPAIEIIKTINGLEHVARAEVWRDGECIRMKTLSNVPLRVWCRCTPDLPHDIVTKDILVFETGKELSYNEIEDVWFDLAEAALNYEDLKQQL